MGSSAGISRWEGDVSDVPMKTLSMLPELPKEAANVDVEVGVGGIMTPSQGMTPLEAISNISVTSLPRSFDVLGVLESD